MSDQTKPAGAGFRLRIVHNPRDAGRPAAHRQELNWAFLASRAVSASECLYRRAYLRMLEPTACSITGRELARGSNASIMIFSLPIQRTGFPDFVRVSVFESSA